MQYLKHQELLKLKGGVSQPVDYDAMTCQALQEYLGIHKGHMSDEELNHWADVYSEKCLGGASIVIPGNPGDPNVPST